MSNLLEKIDKASLVGRGGASFKVARKWKSFQESLAGVDYGYIVANGAEGEPGVKKDGYILEKHLNDFLFSLNLSLHFFSLEKIKKVYLYLNKDYYKKYSRKIKKLLKQKEYKDLKERFVIFIKPSDSGYVGGEETAMLNIIEGKKAESRFRPPFPTTTGLFSKPTLVNNIETFFDIALVSQGKFKAERFYTIAGDVENPGVYQLATSLNVADVLKKTNNYPPEDFFAQIGGNASGEVLNQKQLDSPAKGSALIMVYDLKKSDEKKLLKYWLNFYYQNSCGHCLVCREGTYRLQEMTQKDDYDEVVFWDIVTALADTSLCALGSSLPVPLFTYYRNVKNKPLDLA